MTEAWLCIEVLSQLLSGRRVSYVSMTNEIVTVANVAMGRRRVFSDKSRQEMNPYIEKKKMARICSVHHTGLKLKGTEGMEYLYRFDSVPLPMRILDLRAVKTDIRRQYDGYLTMSKRMVLTRSVWGVDAGAGHAIRTNREWFSCLKRGTRHTSMNGNSIKFSSLIGLLIARALCPMRDGVARHWPSMRDGAIPSGTGSVRRNHEIFAF